MPASLTNASASARVAIGFGAVSGPGVLGNFASAVFLPAVGAVTSVSAFGGEPGACAVVETSACTLGGAAALLAVAFGVGAALRVEAGEEAAGFRASCSS